MTQQSFLAVVKMSAGWVGIEGTTEGIKRTTLPQPRINQAKHLIGSKEGRPSKKMKYLLTEDQRRQILNRPPAKRAYFSSLNQRIMDYFAGKRAELPDKLDLGDATVFQRSVWEATRQIPYGETRSYGWIAKQIGKPGAARAVGHALGKNPLPIIIPCHRVISSDGTLGGFSGGLAMKKRLLALEKNNSGG